MVLPAPDASKHRRLWRRSSASASAAFAEGYIGYFNAERCPRQRQAHHARSDAAADAGAGARHVRPRPHAEGCEDRRRCRRDVDRGGDSAPRRSAAFGRSGMTSCFAWNTGRWSRRSLRRRSRSRSPATSSSSPAAPARLALRPQSCSPSRARMWRSSISTRIGRRRPRRRAGNDSIGIALRCHRQQLGARGVRRHRRPLWRPRHRDLECRRGDWEGAIGEIDDALLRKSFELNFFAHQTCRAECGAHLQGSRAPAACCCSTPRSRRPIRVRISAPTACRRPRRCSCRGSMRWSTARTASAPMRSTPTASAPAC